MPKPYISWALIVRNEEKRLATCLKSVRRATPDAQIVVVDTGSTDQTLEIAREFGCTVGAFEWCDDFAAARNATFALCEGEVYAWIDADDVLLGVGETTRLLRENHLPEHTRETFDIEKMVRRGFAEGFDQLLAPYLYEPGDIPLRERFVKNDGTWTWRGVLHETLEKKRGVPKPGILGNLLFMHTALPLHGSERNWHILQRAHELGLATAKDYATLLTLARQFDPHAVDQWHRVALDHCGTAIERYRVQLSAAPWYRDNGFILEAIAMTKEAIGLFPRLPEGYFAAAEVHAAANLWVHAANHYVDGLTLPAGHPDTRVSEIDKQGRYRLAGAAACLQAAKEFIVAAADGDPGHAKAVELLLSKAAELDETTHNDVAELRMVLRGKDIERKEFPQYWKHHPRTAPPPPVTFYVDAALWPWDRASVKAEGMGASEECITHLADAFNGELYCPSLKNSADFNKNARTHISPHAPLIISRDAALGALFRHIPRKFLWAQDVPVTNLDPETVQDFERVVCVSEWHKLDTSRRAGIAEERIAVIPNFLLREHFTSRPKRERHRFIYASSPDRGLIELLAMWPEIRERWPDATLHVFYGWRAFQRLAEVDGSWTVKHRYLRRRLHQIGDLPGVTHHGMVNAAELAQEMMKSSVWCYPTHFLESDCNTARKVRAAGCVPVCPPLAGLAYSAKSALTVYVTDRDYLPAVEQAFEATDRERDLMAAEALETESLEARLPLWKSLLA